MARSAQLSFHVGDVHYNPYMHFLSRHKIHPCVNPYCGPSSPPWSGAEPHGARGSVHVVPLSVIKGEIQNLIWVLACRCRISSEYQPSYSELIIAPYTTIPRANDTHHGFESNKRTFPLLLDLVLLLPTRLARRVLHFNAQIQIQI